MKGQTSIIILVIVVTAAVLGWAYAMVTGGPSLQERMLSGSGIQESSYLLDETKTSSKLAGQASMYQALIENAKMGGINSYGNMKMDDMRYWYCNGKNIPDASYINYFLSMKTKDLINEYIKDMKNEKRDVSPVECVDYGLSQSSINPQSMSFSAGFFGSKIKIKSPTESESENDFSSKIEDIPYWKMYSRIGKWIEEEQFNTMLCECIPLACDCSPQPGECTTENCKPFFECIKKKLDESVTAKLQESFSDANIECEYTIDECFMEKGASEGGSCELTCHSWNDPPIPLTCYMPEADPVDCSNSASGSGKMRIESKVYSLAERCAGSCYNPLEERISIKVRVSCKDKGYNIISGEESVPFAFGTKLWISQAVGGACKGGEIPCSFDASGNCGCPGGSGTSCNDCKIIGAGNLIYGCEALDCSSNAGECYDSYCAIDASGNPYCKTVLKKRCRCDPDDPMRWCTPD